MSLSDDIWSLIYSYLKWEELAYLAQINPVHQGRLTHPGFLCRFIDSTLVNGLARGIEVLLKSRFYLHQTSCDTVTPITKIKDIKLNRVVIYDHLYYRDIFGRVFSVERGKTSPFIWDREITQMTWFYDDTNYCTGMEMIFLESDGTLVLFQEQRLPLRVARILDDNWSGIIFLDQEGRCGHLSPHHLTYLPPIPPCKDLHISYSIFSIGYYLRYCLTLEGDLFYEYQTTVEQMDRLGRWDKPLLTGVRKMVYFSHDKFYFLTEEKKLLIWDNGRAQPVRRGSPLDEIDDAVSLREHLYLLCQGVLYHSVAFSDIWTVLSTDLSWGKELVVWNLNPDNNDVIIQVS